MTVLAGAGLGGGASELFMSVCQIIFFDMLISGEALRPPPRQRRPDQLPLELQRSKTVLLLFSEIKGVNPRINVLGSTGSDEEEESDPD